MFMEKAIKGGVERKGKERKEKKRKGASEVLSDFCASIRRRWDG
jgi:hypothetical protein